jgi:hypothetical protein
MRKLYRILESRPRRMKELHPQRHERASISGFAVRLIKHRNERHGLENAREPTDDTSVEHLPASLFSNRCLLAGKPQNVCAFPKLRKVEQGAPEDYCTRVGVSCWTLKADRILRSSRAASQCSLIIRRLKAGAA